MKRFTTRLIFLVTAALFLLFLCSPDTVHRAAHESVLFCLSVLIPSLFPGFVLSDLLMGFPQFSSAQRPGLFSRLFGLPPEALRCWWIGLLAGFPSAADSAVRLVSAGKLTKEEAERCLSFTNNPGIVFVVCSVGSGMFGRLSVGVYFWIIQTITGLLIGMLFAKPWNGSSNRSLGSSVDHSWKRVFPRAIVSSVSAVLNICGFVIFFRVLISVLTSAIPLDGLRAILAGFLELTCGIASLPEWGYASAVHAALILGWSGFSVHFQILNVISDADLSVKYYFPGKILQSLISAGLTYATYPLVFASPGGLGEWIPLFCVVMFVVCVFAFRIRKEFLHGKGNL